MKNKIIICLAIFLGVNFLSTISVFAQNTTSTPDLTTIIAELQKQIKELQAQITELKTQLEVVRAEIVFTKILKKGDIGKEVRQLQEFLKSYPEIYPEGLVTGFFGPLTEKAVKKFQKKNAGDILVPKGLTEPTGIVDQVTLDKFNELAATPATPAIPAVPAQPISKTGTSTIPAIPAVPAIPFGLATTTATTTMPTPITATSTAATSTAATSTIAVLYPNGEERWQKGSTQIIKWNSVNVSTVYIKLRKGNDTYPGTEGVVSNIIPNNGFYQWTIPTTLPDGNDYAIRVVAGNIATLDDSNEPFQIVTTPPPQQQNNTTTTTTATTTTTTTATTTTTTTATTTTTTTATTTAATTSTPTSMPIDDTYKRICLTLGWTSCSEYTIYNVNNVEVNRVVGNDAWSSSYLAGISGGGVGGYAVKGKSYNPTPTPIPQTPPVSFCTGLSLTFANNKTAYTQGETVSYTYTCTPSGTASYVEIQVVKPDGTATTYNSSSGNTQSFGFGTDNLAPGNYTLRACFSAGCTLVTASAPFTVVASAVVSTTPSNLTASMTSYGGAVALKWNGNANNITEFRIFSRPQGLTWSTSYDRRGLELLVNTTNNMIEVHIGLVGGATGVYEFKVQACNSLGCSVDSNTASVNVSNFTRSITLLYPNGGEVFAPGSTFSIRSIIPNDQSYYVETFLMPQGSTSVKSTLPAPGTSDVMIDPAVGGYGFCGQALNYPVSQSSIGCDLNSFYPAGIYKIRAYLLPRDESSLISAIAQDESDNYFSIVPPATTATTTPSTATTTLKYIENQLASITEVVARLAERIKELIRR